jgi:hypothetical protein
MALKSSLFRAATAILIWLCLSWAGQTLCNLPLLSAIAASPQVQDLGTAEPQRPQTMQRYPTPDEAPPPFSAKQKRSILKSNFEKMRHDVNELADLTKQLQGDLDKSNENVLSLAVMDKADKIEKLAKKIKASAHGT